MKTTGSFIKVTLCSILLLAVCTGRAALPDSFPDEGTARKLSDRDLSRARISAVKANVLPVIDGKLDDSIWQKAVPYTDFRTFEPDVGSEISETTFAYAAYDQENIYFAFRCLDSHPDQIKASRTKRDNMFDEDLVGVFLDTYNDCQGAYVFMVNPYGVQGDIMMNAQGNGEPQSADFVWESQGNLTEAGYTVEIRVPLQSIRFACADLVTMGVGLHRQIIRTSERTMYPEISPGKGSLIAQSGIIQFQGLRGSQLLEILPAVTWTNLAAHQEGEMESTFNRKEFGITAKVGITPTLTLDGTFNPDFSQVEADARQLAEVNSRYAIYYSETRPFFIEGQEQFDFAGLKMASPLRQVVHTRTIVNPVAGVKLSGKLGDNNTVASIMAVDDYPGADKQQKAGVGILRFKHLLGDDSYVGAMATSRSMGSSHNQSVGMDIRKRINGSFMIDGSLLGSLTSGPDEGSNGGGSVNLFGSYEKTHYDISAAFHHISEDFAIDPGYILRTGVSSAAFQYSRSIFSSDNGLPKPLRWMFNRFSLQRIFYGIYAEGLNDLRDRMNEGAAQLFLNFAFPRTTSLRLSFTKASEIYAARSFAVDFVSASISSQPLAWLTVFSSITSGGYPYYDPEAPYQGDRTNMAVAVTVKPTRDLTADLTHSRSIFSRRSSGEEIYDFPLYRGKLTYQINKYLFIRGIMEYDAMNDMLSTDFLASFTYIPGTVIHLGYGARHQRLRYLAPDYVEANRFMAMQQGLFVKASYNWIL